MTPLVLCYHAVSPTWEHRLCIQPDLLLRQVRALSRFRNVQVTFDDAFRSSATVFPPLERLGVRIEIFVCTSYAREGASLAIPELQGDDPAELATMTWDELRTTPSAASRSARIRLARASHPALRQRAQGRARGLESGGRGRARQALPGSRLSVRRARRACACRCAPRGLRTGLRAPCSTGRRVCATAGRSLSTAYSAENAPSRFVA